MPLPVAGLMSLMSFEEVREALIPLRAAARSLGVVLQEPFLQVAFLPLPVIPHLKITDKGLVDVDGFEFVRDSGREARGAMAKAKASASQARIISEPPIGAA